MRCLHPVNGSCYCDPRCGAKYSKIGSGKGNKVEGATPMESEVCSHPGVEKELLSVQIAMSHVATSWHPAAAANPSTLAMTGTGLFMISIISSEALWKISLWDSVPLSEVWKWSWVINGHDYLHGPNTSSFRLCPEEKTFPVEEITIHRSDLLSCPQVIPSINSFIVSMEREFLAFGLFSCRFRTPFSSSISTVFTQVPNNLRVGRVVFQRTLKTQNCFLNIASMIE